MPKSQIPISNVQIPEKELELIPNLDIGIWTLGFLLGIWTFGFLPGGRSC